MKQSILKRALLTACLGVSMAGVAMAGPVGPVIIPQAGDVVIINHGPDMTFTGNKMCIRDRPHFSLRRQLLGNR